MFSKFLKKAKEFGRKHDQENSVEEPKAVEEKSLAGDPNAEAQGGTTTIKGAASDDPQLPSASAATYKGPEEQKDPDMDIPPDNKDNKRLIQNGYDKVRETAPTKYVIQTSFKSPTVDNPKRVIRKTVELYGFSALQAINMIGWRPSKCKVIKQEPRTVSNEAPKADEKAPAGKKKATKVQEKVEPVNDVSILVGEETKGKLPGTVGMQWKRVIRAAKDIPEVKEALAGKVVIDRIVTKAKVGVGGTLKFVLRNPAEIPPPAKKKDEQNKETGASVEAVQESAAAEEKSPDVASGSAAVDPGVEHTAVLIDGNRRVRREQKRAEDKARAEAEAAEKAVAEAAAAAEKAVADAKAAAEAAEKLVEEAKAIALAAGPGTDSEEKVESSSRVAETVVAEQGAAATSPSVE